MARRLLLGITGGIAAFKAPLILREFMKLGIEVRTVATLHALEFVTETTLSALSGAPVSTDLFKERAEFEHLELTRWADAMVVAPATANIIGKFAWGVADDLLSTLYVAFRKPVVIVPAMNHNMWVADSTQKNLRTLMERGVKVVNPTTGMLACGDEGAGRMADVEDIVARGMSVFAEQSALAGKKVLVTAGATREFIDPVRFITNRSSGKMGFAVADAFHRYGAEVTLVAGPTELLPALDVKLVRVTSAEEMYNAVMAAAPDADVIVKAAAVADYTPETISEQKVKKGEGARTIKLVRTRDILKQLGENKKPGQVLVGFSAETENHLENAVKKLGAKNLDMIVLNDVKSADAGFEVDTNRVMVISRAIGAAAEAGTAGGEDAGTVYEKEVGGVRVMVRAYPLMSKILVAERIVEQTLELI